MYIRTDSLESQLVSVRYYPSGPDSLHFSPYLCTGRSVNHSQMLFSAAKRIRHAKCLKLLKSLFFSTAHMG